METVYLRNSIAETPMPTPPLPHNPHPQTSFSPFTCWQKWWVPKAWMKIVCGAFPTAWPRSRQLMLRPLPPIPFWSSSFFFFFFDPSFQTNNLCFQLVCPSGRATAEPKTGTDSLGEGWGSAKGRGGERMVCVFGRGGGGTGNNSPKGSRDVVMDL